MAVTTGSVPNLNSLIDAVRVFTTANGWTNNHYGDIGAGKRLHISRGSVFINLRTCVNENPYDYYGGITDVEQAGHGYALWANISTAFAGSGERWYRQTGAPYRSQDGNNTYEYCGITQLTGSMNYWMFAFDNSFYLVIESPAGVFHWLGWGKLTPKFGDWGGGEYLFAKHYSGVGGNYEKSFPLFGSYDGGQGQIRSYVKVNGIDGQNGWVRGMGAGTASGNIRSERVFDNISRSKTLWELTPNIVSSKPVPLPFTIWMTRNGGNVDYNQPVSYLGALEKIYFINLYGLIPGTLYPDGTGAIYRVFPFHQKVEETNLQHPNYTTGRLGYAIRTN